MRCYDLKFLKSDNRTTLVLKKYKRTLLQTSLPYIVLQMVHANYCAPYPKQPCVVHEANM